MRGDGWKVIEDPIHSKLRIVHEERNTDFARARWRDNHLRPLAPVNLDETGPRCDRVVSAETEARSNGEARAQACELADTGMLAISTDEPFARNENAVYAGTLKIKSRDPRAPQHGDSDLCCPIHQELVQRGAAQTHAPPFGNFSADCGSFV